MNKITEQKNKNIYIKVTCAAVGISVLMLSYLTLKMIQFLPATLIMLALFFFCICYYFKDDDDKKLVMYLLFGLGVGLVIFSVFYTLMETM